jgi:hypothetical protein
MPTKPSKKFSKFEPNLLLVLHLTLLYGVILVAVCFTLDNNPQGVKLIPLAQILGQSAQILVDEENKKSKLSTPENSEKKQ